MNSQFLEYGALDAACTMQAHNAFWPDLSGGGFQPAYDMTIDLLPVISFMQTRGIKVDHPALQTTRTEILSSAATKQEELNRLCGRELNVNSPKDCQTYFYVELGIPPYYNEGSVTVDDLALQRLSRGTAKRPGLRQAKLVQEIRGLQKLDGTYLNLEFDADGRMRCSYNPRGCLLPETEVLTKTGWVSLANFHQGDEALQWASDGKLTWTKPKKVVYDCSEVLLECQSEQHNCVYTGDHRIPSYQPNTSKFEVRTAIDTAKTYRQLPVSGLIESTSEHTPRTAQLLAMIQADGCVSEGSIILSFKKERKIIRCREILDLFGFNYTTPKGGEGYSRFVIGVKEAAPIVKLLGKEKLFGAWVLSWDVDTMRAFLDELQHWDGSIDQDRTVVRYVTKQQTNASWVATVAHLCGRSSYTTKIFEGQDRNPLWRVSIKNSTRVSLKTSYWKPYKYTGQVYCLETETGFFLARNKNNIFVTGNTKFGRLSSSKTIFGTGTNMQNLPQEFKKFLVADDGYVFWEIDKRQAEWVVVAYLANDANMIRVVENGEDVHRHTASLMFGVEAEVIDLENKIVGYNTDADVIQALRMEDDILARFCTNFPRTMSGRQCGKKSNHGLNYDEGYIQFALVNEIEQTESKRVVNAYHSIYPGIRATYHEGVKRQLQKDRALTNCFGRKVRFMDAWGPDLWKAAYSMLPQSSVVDSLNKGMVKIYNSPELCGTDGWNIDVLAQVHDSILLQVPITLVKSGLVNQYGASTILDIKKKVFDSVSPDLNYNGHTFKIATDQKFGFNWGGVSKTNPMGMQEVKTLNELQKLLEAVSEPRAS